MDFYGDLIGGLHVAVKAGQRLDLSIGVDGERRRACAAERVGEGVTIVRVFSLDWLPNRSVRPSVLFQLLLVVAVGNSGSSLTSVTVTTTASVPVLFPSNAGQLLGKSPASRGPAGC